MIAAGRKILAPHTIIDGLADSKLLRPKRREKLFAAISADAVESAFARRKMEEVDQMNIYWAAMEARQRRACGLCDLVSSVAGVAGPQLAACRKVERAKWLS